MWLRSATSVKLEVPKDLPRLSWPCGITFDTQRRRLLVASLGGVGHLYAYEPDREKWSVLTDLDNLDLAALTYCPWEDALYALANPFSTPSFDTLHKFTPDGVHLKRIPLARPIPNQGILGAALQLVAAEPYLVAVTPPAEYLPETRDWFRTTESNSASMRL